MNKQLAEFIGTFALVFFGCGAAAIGGMGTGATAVDLLGIASAFGFAIVAMAYGIGPISGCHVNPAVSFGVFVAGRMSAAEMVSLLDRPGDRRDRRGRRALSDPVGQSLRAGTAASGRTGGDPAISASTTCSPRFVFEIVATFLFLVMHSRRHPPFHADGFRWPRHRPDAGRRSISSASTSPASRSIRPARSARRWSASPQIRSAWRSSGCSSSRR